MYIPKPHITWRQIPMVRTTDVSMAAYMKELGITPQQDTVPATPFDPTSIAALLDEQWAAWPAIAVAMRRCTTQWVIDEETINLVDPASPEADLPLRASIFVQCPERGEIRLMILNNDFIADLTFMDIDLPQYRAFTKVEEFKPRPSFTVVHRRWEHGSEG